MKKNLKNAEQFLNSALQLSTYCYFTFYLAKAGYSLEEAEELMNVTNKLESQSDHVKEITEVCRKYIENIDKNNPSEKDGSLMLIKMVAYLMENWVENGISNISEEYFHKEFNRFLLQNTSKIIQNLVNKGKSLEEGLKILRLTNAFNLNTVH